MNRRNLAKRCMAVRDTLAVVHNCTAIVVFIGSYSRALIVWPFMRYNTCRSRELRSLANVRVEEKENKNPVILLPAREAGFQILNVVPHLIALRKLTALARSALPSRTGILSMSDAWSLRLISIHGRNEALSGATMW